jgi:predicted transcriptional regulator
MYPASFKQLQALMLVARHQSVSRAAEAMHVTQPAVSLHLKLLEEAAGWWVTRSASSACGKKRATRSRH